MECHPWTGAPRCYLEMLDQLQKRISKTAGLSRNAFLEPSAHHRNLGSSSIF